MSTQYEWVRKPRDKIILNMILKNTDQISTYSCFIPTNIFSIVVHLFFYKRLKSRYRKGGNFGDKNVDKAGQGGKRVDRHVDFWPAAKYHRHNLLDVNHAQKSPGMQFWVTKSPVMIIASYSYRNCIIRSPLTNQI